MKEENKLVKKYGRDTGFRVPDGYFDTMRKEVINNLPPYPEAPRKVDLTLWQRLKPYVSLAAMFAGIWLMMQMFHNFTSVSTLNIDNPPENVAIAMANIDNQDAYISPFSASDFEIEEEVGANYSSIADFERDFDYKLDPEFDAIKIN